MIVYWVEYLLIENLIIDYLILLITKKVTKNNSNNIRLILSSLIGAVYTILALLKQFEFLGSLSLKLSISVLMIVIAFNPVKFKEFLKLYATFYMISFVFAGAALSLIYLTDSEVYIVSGLFFIKGITLKILVISIVVSLLIIKITKNYFLNKGSKVILSTTVVLNDLEVQFPGLIDTGNSLKDPISNLPVIIVEFNAIKNILPKEVQEIFNRYQENNINLVSEIMIKAKDLIKFRLIPFKSLGKENGMLLGFKPDIVKFTESNGISQNIIIGIYNNTLCNTGEYKALLNPDIINMEEGEVINV